MGTANVTIVLKIFEGKTIFFFFVQPLPLMLQVFQNKKLCSIIEGLSIHLVEASPAMAELQASTIQASQLTTPTTPPSSSPASLRGVELGEQEEAGLGENCCYQSGRVAGNVPVAWYKQLKDVPQGLDGQLQCV